MWNRILEWKESGGKVAEGHEELEARVGSDFKSKVSANLLQPNFFICAIPCDM